MHQMPQDRLVPDWDHRLGDAFGDIADAGAEAAAEQNCFHLNTVLQGRYRSREGVRQDMVGGSAGVVSLDCEAIDRSIPLPMEPLNKSSTPSDPACKLTRGSGEACRWRYGKSTKRQDYSSRTEKRRAAEACRYLLKSTSL